MKRLSHLACLWLSLIFVSLVPPKPTLALGFSGGSGDGGCCVPKPLVRHAQRLQSELSATDADAIRRAQFTETICETFACGALTETQANRLVEDHFRRLERSRESFKSWLAIAISLLSALAAVGAFAVSWRSERIARGANDRAIRNETLIETLQET